MKRLLVATALAAATAACGGSSHGDDTGVDASAATCGDGTCDMSESHASCPADCQDVGCGNGTCDMGETAGSCPADCHAPVCGDGTCDPGETSASCAADCPSTCGNGTCDAGEDAASCPTDCDPTACTLGPDTCTGENVCVAGHCVSAFGRNYLIDVESGVYPQDDANGSPWDIGGGLPDPVVVITINGADQTTPVLTDTLTPTWHFITPPTLIPGGTVFQIDAYDSDVGFDDLAWSCLNNPLTADLIRTGMSCSGTGALSAGHVEVYMTPN